MTTWSLREKIRLVVTVGIGGSLALACLSVYLQTGAALGMTDAPMPFGHGHSATPVCEPWQTQNYLSFGCIVPNVP